jgi:hypothetical protein
MTECGPSPGSEETAYSLPPMSQFLTVADALTKTA